MFQRLAFNISGTVRYDVLEGRRHLVAPASMLGEGVWEGSEGPVFYSGEELEKWVPSWNNKPAVVYHPKTETGDYTSACDSLTLNTRGIGRVLSTRYKDSALRSEVWLDVERTRSIDNRILVALEKGEKVEISTGLFFDAEMTAGEYKGKKYGMIARNHRPDHLAILPDQIGAFSIASGGGLLALNAAVSRQPERTQQILLRGLWTAAKPCGGVITGNELSFSQIGSQLVDVLASTYGQPGRYWSGYICEIYPDRVIFYGPTGPSSPVDMDQLWMVGYTITDTDVTLNGDPVSVERVVTYRTPSGDSYTANTAGGLTQVKKETEMAFDKKVHVNSLIGHGFVEADRVWLEKLDEPQLEKIKPVVNTGDPPPPPVPAPAAPPPAPPVKPQTFEEMLANADPKRKRQFAAMEKAFTERRKQWIDKILANTEAEPGKPSVKREFLEEKDDEELAWLANSTTKSTDKDEGNDSPFLTDYSAGAGGPVANVGPYNDEFLPLPKPEPAKQTA